MAHDGKILWLGKLLLEIVEPHGQEPVAPIVRRNPPKLQSSFAKASEDTRIPPRSGDRGFLRRRVKTFAAQELQRLAQAVVQYRLNSVGWVFAFSAFYLLNITLLFLFAPLNFFLGTILE